MTRRIVRVGSAFFDDLDRQLGPDRGPDGQPSTTDFLVTEVPAIVERFATGFEALPEAVEGVAEARMAIGTGKLVRAFAVYGILMSDESVEPRSTPPPSRLRTRRVAGWDAPLCRGGDMLGCSARGEGAP